jgi:hypothetical protein
LARDNLQPLNLVGCKARDARAGGDLPVEGQADAAVLNHPAQRFITCPRFAMVEVERERRGATPLRWATNPTVGHQNLLNRLHFANVTGNA